MLSMRGFQGFAAVVIVSSFILFPASSFGQKTKKPASKPAQKTPDNQSKGQNQLTGGYIKFGETYGLKKTGLNFAILKASYSVEPFPSYSKLSATADKKFFILDISVKNYLPKDNDYFPEISVVDASGTKYTDPNVSLRSYGVKEFYSLLKPGQGFGQAGLNDPLRVAFHIPLEAKITKIMVNDSRINKNEEVVRYLVAGTDKEADPANVVQTPAVVADMIDPSGQAVKFGRAKIGESFVSYYNTYRVNSVKTTSDAIEDGVFPEEGKQFVVVSVTVKNSYLVQASFFDSLNLEGVFVKDSEGDKVQAMGLYKGSVNEKFDGNGYLEPGDERTVRYLFQISSKTKPNTLLFSAHPSYLAWQIPLGN